MAEVAERFDAVIFAERGAARLEKRLGREHEDPQPWGGLGQKRGMRKA